MLGSGGWEGSSLMLVLARERYWEFWEEYGKEGEEVEGVQRSEESSWRRQTTRKRGMAQRIVSRMR